MCDFDGKWPARRTAKRRESIDVSLSGELIDLSQPLIADPVHAFGRPRVSLETLATVQEYGFNVTGLSTYTHAGTHVDVPRHFQNDGKALDAFPIDSWIGRGVVGRVAGKASCPIMQHDVFFSSPPRCGDFLFIDTGWHSRYGLSDYYDHPYLDESFARNLSELQISLLGVDLPNPDQPARLRGSDFSWPVHRILLGSGIRIVENVASMKRLTNNFNVIVAPLPLQDVDGAPVRIFATTS